MKRICLLVTTLLLAACAANGSRGTAAGAAELTFFHLNDTYRIDAVENGSAGGFGRVVTLLRDAESGAGDVRLLHGGDFLYPSLESQLWDGRQMVDAFNFMDAIAPMLVVAGNHEFDRRTPGELAAAVRHSNFDWLGDNYAFRTGDAGVDDRLLEAYTFESRGRTIGVFALTLAPEDGGNARDYAPVSRDYAAIAERTIETLEAQGAELIVGLTHLHIHIDEEIAKLKAAHPKFLFVVGGHEHEPEYLPATPGSAAVMKGASNARQIWRIDIGFSPRGPRIADNRLIEIDETIASDPAYAELEQKWRGRLLAKFPFLTARVGRAAVPLDAREVTVRNEESGWANFIVDQMRRAFGSPPADLAFINGGTLRLDDYVSGDILFEDIGRTFGFSSYLRYLTLSGAEFRDVLEAGFRGKGPSKGYFPQVSGFRVCADRSRRDGERIVALELPGNDGWREIDPAADYLVVVPDYLYRGGDGYRFPEHTQASRPGSELRYLVLDAIMRAQAEGRAIGTHPDPDDPRIVVLDAPGLPCFP